MSHGSWLQLPLVFLAAAVLAVPLARYLRLGAILGYLVAGLLIGPEVLGLIPESTAIPEVAELGVVLMLFLVGLELEPKRLWAMRRPIFGWGSVQLLGCTAVLTALGIATGHPWRLSLVVSLGLAMSSTAVALAVLAERNLGRTTAGESILSVALLQDIAAIPVLALVPVLALSGGMATTTAAPGWRRPRRWAPSSPSSSAAGCCCARRCAGSPAARRPRSSPPRPCCWCWARLR